MNLQRTAFGAAMVGVAAATIVLALVSSGARPVVAPMLVATLIVLWTGLVLWTREGKIPLFDVGLICAFATLVYMAIPLLGYLGNGLRFTIDSDPRLFKYQPRTG